MISFVGRRQHDKDHTGEKEPLLKAICAGHQHITISEQFSPTARQFLVGGNFLFHGQEILFT